MVWGLRIQGLAFRVGFLGFRVQGSPSRRRAAGQRGTIPFSTMLYYTVLYYIILHYAILYHTIRYFNTILH